MSYSLRVVVSPGVYSNSYDASLNVKNGFPVFSTVIEANSIGKQKNEFAAFKLTDEDRQEIHRLARDPRIGELSQANNALLCCQTAGRWHSQPSAYSITLSRFACMSISPEL